MRTFFMVDESFMNDKIAFFIQAEDEFGSILAEGTGTERKIENTDFEYNPIEDFADVPLVDDCIPLIGGKRVNRVRTYWFIEELREAEADAIVSLSGTPTKSTEGGRRNRLRPVDVSLALAEGT